jgi:hypothetical protein
MATRQRICRVQILRMLRVLARVLADAFLARFVLMLWLARLANIRQAVLRGLARLDNIRRAVFPGLARLDDIRQAVLHGLARLAKDEFGEFYANLSSLAILANLASVG